MRRQVLHALGLALAHPASALASQSADQPAFAAVTADQRLQFPRDHGAHPDFRIEWWYVTAWAHATRRGAAAEDIGIQITFFRVNTGWQRAHKSRFAARQLLFAHAALALSSEARLITAERAARLHEPFARAEQGDTRLTLDRWRFERHADDHYQIAIEDSRFSLALTLHARHAPLLQGEAGFSQKGPQPAQASYYYSRPHLALSGSLERRTGDARDPARQRLDSTSLKGQAWFDHEWSSELLDERAEGWDWVGLQLDDGSALMAFRIRSRHRDTLWSDANWVDAQHRRQLTPERARSVRFEPLRHWRSPRSGANWPVAMRIVIGERTLELRPLIDDQELNTQASTGITYWEGAVTVIESGQTIGRGYLELTGYAQALRI